MKRSIIIIFLLASIFSCKKKNAELPIEENIYFYFSLDAKNNPEKIKEDVYCDLKGDSLIAIIPYMENASSFIASFSAKNASVKVNGVAQVSGVTVNDFSKPVEYTVTSTSGTAKIYHILVRNTGLPIFFLTTSAPVISKDEYVTGTLVINPNGQFEQEKKTIGLQVKGRGNSTWGMPKKPYRFKFTDKAKMLGLASAKNWVLLANYSDKTLMRTSIAFDLGQQIMTGFSPHGRHVDLVMNGEYQGSYLLTEQMEVYESRINITELKPTNNSATEITGGYFIEQDERLGEPVNFFTAKGLPMNIKSPENISSAQLTYIKDYLQKTEDAIFSTNFDDPIIGYEKYIDVNSFINWFLIQELLKNQDAQKFSSIFFYKNRDGKLTLGPIWDFDLAMGNVNYSEATKPTGWWVKEGLWFNRLFQDPAFKARVVSRWTELKTKEIPGILPYIDKLQNKLNYSQQVNFKKWDILNIYVWPNPVVLGTYNNEVEHIKSWLNTRISWIDENLNK